MALVRITILQVCLSETRFPEAKNVKISKKGPFKADEEIDQKALFFRNSVKMSTKR